MAKRIILYNICCLRYNKADVKNVSIRTLYLNLVHFKVISNVNLFYLLSGVQEIKLNYKEQETLVHAPKLWAEKNSKRALIIVSINKMVTVYSLHNMYVDEFREDRAKIYKQKKWLNLEVCRKMK